MPSSLTIRVRYPSGRGDLSLRTSDDWATELRPDEVSGDEALFQLETRTPILEFKALLTQGGQARWQRGHNQLAYPPRQISRTIYPHFFEAAFQGSVTGRRTLPDDSGDLCYRMYLPPGYTENTLRRYPTLYMQDGANLFFPEEAFGGREWGVDEAMDTLNGLAIIQSVVVVGVAARPTRMDDYGGDAYPDYLSLLTDRLKPAVEAELRCLSGPTHTGVMGSSMGGLFSFMAAWDRPEIFGLCGAISASFSERPELLSRVEQEDRRAIRIYLDSGSPLDNFEETRRMRDLLMLRGYAQGADLLALTFPGALHNESAWGSRVAVPFQFLFGD